MLFVAKFSVSASSPRLRRFEERLQRIGLLGRGPYCLYVASLVVSTQDKITPSLYREVVGLVVRLREQKISMERLRLERARFELDIAELVMKHIDKLKSSGVLQIEDRGEAAKKIRELMFGKYTKEQLEAAKFSVV